MKKLLSLLLSVSMLCVMLAGFSLTVSASEKTEGIYTYTVDGGKATITAVSDSVSGNVIIPSTLGGYPVAVIERNTFMEKQAITGVVIPSTVTEVTTGAFYNCKSLVTAQIPGSIKMISNSMFRGCSALKNVTIGNGVTEIGKEAFNGCTNLETINFPNGIVSIGQFAFYNCVKLKKIDLPDSIKSIGVYAFVESGYYKDSSNWDGEVLFIGNHLITASVQGHYDVPAGTKSIATAAFSHYMLESVTIPDTVIGIDTQAFYACGGLTKATIPASVTYIGKKAFTCPTLTVEYGGSEKQWKKIEKGEDAVPASATINWQPPEIQTNSSDVSSNKKVDSTSSKNSSNTTSRVITHNNTNSNKPTESSNVNSKKTNEDINSKNLSNAEQNTVVQEQQTNQSDTQSLDNANSQENEKEKEKFPANTILVVVIVFVLCAALVVTILLLRNKKKKS